MISTGSPEKPVFVIFVPVAKPETCDATWLKARSEQKATDAGGRVDVVEPAFVDNLRIVPYDLRAPRLSVLRGLRQKTDAGGVRQWRPGWSRSGP